VQLVWSDAFDLIQALEQLIRVIEELCAEATMY
jgi:hypothetical protein